MSEYLVIYERTENGWGAYCPDLPGLGVVGDTREEVERLISEGIAIHIEGLREHGDPVPEPTSTAGTVAYIPAELEPACSTQAGSSAMPSPPR